MNKVLNCLKRKTWKTNVTKLTTDDFETSTSTGISKYSSTTKHAKSTETRGRKTHRIISNFISKTLQQWSCMVWVSESYEEKESKMDNDDQISVEQPVTGVSACQSNSEQRKRIAWAQDTLWKRPKAAKGSRTTPGGTKKSCSSKQSDIEKFNIFGSSSSSESDDLMIMDLSDYSDYEIGVEERNSIPHHDRWTGY